MRQLLFRRNYYRGIAQLSPAARLEVYDAIMRYAFSGESTEVSKECAPMLSMILENIDVDFDNYERRNAENPQKYT